MILCPKCSNEILPYLKTGELKRVEEEIDVMFERSLVSYQCYFCYVCKVVYYNEHEEFIFKSLQETIKEVEDESE